MENYTFGYPYATPSMFPRSPYLDARLHGFNNFSYQSSNILPSSLLQTLPPQPPADLQSSFSSLALQPTLMNRFNIGASSENQFPTNSNIHHLIGASPENQFPTDSYIYQPTRVDVDSGIYVENLPFLNVQEPRFTRNADVNRWTEEEDRELRRLVGIIGERPWAKIADLMGRRTGKQCRERWKNHLSEDIVKKKAWTKAEEEKIIEVHKEGGMWAKISTFLPGRSENDVKNHWYSTKRKLQRRPAKTPFEHYIVESTTDLPKYDPYVSLPFDLMVPNNSTFSNEDSSGKESSSSNAIRVHVKEIDKEVVDGHAEVQLWTNLDKCIKEENAFLMNLFP